MRAAFGSPVGIAAWVELGTKVPTIMTTEANVDHPREAVRQAGSKLPTPWDLVVKGRMTDGLRVRVALHVRATLNRRLRFPSEVMGVFRVRVRVFPLLEPGSAREVEMVVDTGASYSVVPRPMAEALGIVPSRRITVTLADGTRTVREMGRAEVEYAGLGTPTWIIFGEPSDATILGAHALEGMGLEVDSRAQSLRPAEAYLLTFGSVQPRSAIESMVLGVESQAAFAWS